MQRMFQNKMIVLEYKTHFSKFNKYKIFIQEDFFVVRNSVYRCFWLYKFQVFCVAKFRAQVALCSSLWCYIWNFLQNCHRFDWHTRALLQQQFCFRISFDLILKLLQPRLNTFLFINKLIRYSCCFINLDLY